MKILIIGSKGFIGGHCVDFFSQKHEVWGCDVVLDYNSTRYISIDAVDSDDADNIIELNGLNSKLIVIEK